MDSKLPGEGLTRGRAGDEPRGQARTVTRGKKTWPAPAGSLGASARLCPAAASAPTAWPGRACLAQLSPRLAHGPWMSPAHGNARFPAGELGAVLCSPLPLLSRIISSQSFLFKSLVIMPPLLPPAVPPPPSAHCQAHLCVSPRPRPPSPRRLLATCPLRSALLSEPAAASPCPSVRLLCSQPRPPCW